MATTAATKSWRADWVERRVGASQQLRSKILAADSPLVDLVKVRVLAATQTLPDEERVPVWRLLLGVASCLPESRQLVDAHRREEAQLAWQTMKNMGRTERIRQRRGRRRTYGGSGEKHDEARVEDDDDDDEPTAEDLAWMVLLAEGRLACEDEDVVTTRRQPDLDALTIVGRSMMAIVHGSSAADWTDGFQLTWKLNSLLAESWPTAVETTKRTAVIRDEFAPPLVSSLAKRRIEKAGQWRRVPLALRTAGASLLKSHTAICGLWDKVAMGTCTVPLLHFFILHFMMELARSLDTDALLPSTELLFLRREADEVALVKRVLEEAKRAGLFRQQQQQQQTGVTITQNIDDGGGPSTD